MLRNMEFLSVQQETIVRYSFPNEGSFVNQWALVFLLMSPRLYLSSYVSVLILKQIFFFHSVSILWNFCFNECLYSKSRSFCLILYSIVLKFWKIYLTLSHKICWLPTDGELLVDKTFLDFLGHTVLMWVCQDNSYYHFDNEFLFFFAHLRLMVLGE